MLLIIGDIDAKVGGQQKQYRSKGNDMTVFSVVLAVGGTLFQHKNIHKITGTSPDGITKVQINHILNNRKGKSYL